MDHLRFHSVTSQLQISEQNKNEHITKSVLIDSVVIQRVMPIKIRSFSSWIRLKRLKQYHRGFVTLESEKK